MAGRFGSVVTAMVTPFRDDHAVDLDGARSLASWLIDNGSDAVVVAGSTGESPTLTHKEKAELFRAVGDAIRGRGKLICGVGTYSTAETLELTQAAEDADADGLLVVTPYYNKPPQRGLVAHFERVADATELPIIAYNIPGRTATRIEHATLLQLSEKPNIVAVKDSTGDFQGISRLIAEAPEGFEVYSGDDWATFGYVCLGCGRRGQRRGPPRGPADPPDDRPDRDRRRAGGPQGPRGAEPAVQRPVRHLEPDPAEGRARDGRPPGGTAAPAARAGHHGGTRPRPQGPGGRRSPLTRPTPRS